MFRILFLTMALLLSACGSSDDTEVSDSVQLVMPGLRNTSETAVYRDTASWDAVWEANADKNVAKPEIDFSKRMVLAVFIAHSSGCGNSELLDVVFTANGVFVYYRDNRGTPGPANVVCTAVITHTSHGVSIPVTTKPISFIRQ